MIDLYGLSLPVSLLITAVVVQTGIAEIKETNDAVEESSFDHISNKVKRPRNRITLAI